MRGRAILLSAAAALAAAAALVAATGGGRVVLLGVRVSMRSPVGLVAASLASGAAWWWLAGRARRRELEDAWAWIERRARAIILAVAALSAVAAAIWATNAPSGSDASGYLSEAALLASRHLATPDPLMSLPGWPSNPWLSTPLGWRPALAPGFQVPTYAVGLPMLMAIPHAISGTWGACLVVAVSAGVAVWATGMTALRLASPASGVIAAVAIATMPVFLYQSFQPMSDVPVTAAWMTVWALLARGTKAPIGAGLACALAVLVRPNLAPLAAVPAILVALGARRWRDVAAFAAPVAAAGLVVAAVQWQWYGSPMRSGYGAASDLFDAANVGANLSRYTRWVMDTWPLILITPIGAVVLRGRREMRPLVAFAAGVVAAYLVYAVFEEWWYLRFMLPALAVAAVFAAAALDVACGRLPPAARAPALAALLISVAATSIGAAQSRGTFRLAAGERRVVDLGMHLTASMPAEAVIVCGEESGAMRYLTGRAVVRWDLASPDELSATLAALAAAGRPVWVVLDAWEVPLVRERFSSTAVGALDWPPAVEAGDVQKTSAWRLSDRQAFVSGARIDTVKLAGRAR